MTEPQELIGLVF